MSVGSLLALFGLFDERARPDFCVCARAVGLTLSLSFVFSFPTLAGVGQPIIHELNIQGIRLCVSRPGHFDCVLTLTNAVAPTGVLRMG